jgi:hypothetical protein
MKRVWYNIIKFITKMLPSMQEYKKLDLATQKRFEAKLIALFGDFDTFWRCNKKHGFKLSYDVKGDQLHVIRMRKCISCDTESYSVSLITKSEVQKEMLKTSTILCPICSQSIEQILVGPSK